MRNTFVYSNQMNTISLISGVGEKLWVQFFRMIAHDGNFKFGKYVARNYQHDIISKVMFCTLQPVPGAGRR